MVHIGIDAVEIERFAQWRYYSKRKLSRIFSLEEIAYSLSVPEKTAERFAVRYASKEALYKALTALISPSVPFLKLCSACQIQHDVNRQPVMKVNWEKLHVSPQALQVSLTHTRTTAFAVILVEELTAKLRNSADTR